MNIRRWRRLVWIEVGSQPAQVAGRRLLVDWGVDERRIALPQSDDVLPELTHNLSAESATDPEYRVAFKVLYRRAQWRGGNHGIADGATGGECAPLCGLFGKTRHR